MPLGARIVPHRVMKRFKAMEPNGKLRAWIERQPGGKCVAGFIGVAVTPDGKAAIARREPATHVCSSPDMARRWVDDEASAFGLPVEWVESGAGGH
jgi:hypothetical protein